LINILLNNFDLGRKGFGGASLKYDLLD